MILRCPYRQCDREIDTDFNTLGFDKNKGRGYVCPFCHKFIRISYVRKKPAPRNRPHISKKERRKQRAEEKAEAKAPAKEAAC